MIMLKKETPLLVFMERIQLPHREVLVLESRVFHHKVLYEIYRNSKFNILVKFNFVLLTS